ncbi:hypothetical protein [Carboxydothermus hydrogenoformans]|uniref:Uncharacterized protein n=1 Tax=Carboxydothermus hydrogenoformans (strain ATCC BAA-161 / DSM 6008 / Z-2901) TaxID=246194 RepID=Q3A9C7_CARHZ|nr:hypothetical protein [Carboxydothermus hydrogenoformans]ABB14107.1 hypothetical protein CHY_2463 [Carboxydothermus hydrogenoformans Z-2901]
MKAATKVLTLLVLFIFILGNITLASGGHDSVTNDSSMFSGNMEMSKDNMNNNKQNTLSAENTDMSNDSTDDHQQSGMDSHEASDSHASSDIPWSFLKVIGILNTGIILTGLISRYLPEREELKNESGT